MNVFKGPLKKTWEKIGATPHHGIALPLSALHTEKSCGAGEFLDLIPLIDWCQHIGMDTIQLLPLNDSGNDPSPYNATSSCALNPLYLSLHALPFLEEYPELTALLTTFKPYNLTPRIEYHTVLEKKMEWLNLYFEKIGSFLIKDPQFHQFVSDNPWVESFSLFKVLKINFKDLPWQEWPQEFKHPNEEQNKLLIEEYWVHLCFYTAVQYLCFQQLQEVKKYAEEKNVYIMGDIPILISPDSADVWKEREIFDLSKEAGAPPDMYIEAGQNWGFPLYRWDVIEKQNYAWWNQRLCYAEHFFDLYRIDHIVGFFRIWGIPRGHTSGDGQFVPEDEAAWGPQGKKVLNHIIHTASKMLPIGEDLGTVPDITRETLHDLGICGTKVMRWERKWKEESQFIPIEEYDPLSMTTVSTHDSETLSQWWKNMPEEAQAYATFKHWRYTPDLTQEERKQILWDSHHTSSFFHINPLQEYLAYFPELISPNPDEERINVPGQFLSTNWTYRFRPSVEELHRHPYLNQFMQHIHV